MATPTVWTICPWPSLAHAQDRMVADLEGQGPFAAKDHILNRLPSPVGHDHLQGHRPHFHAQIPDLASDRIAQFPETDHGIGVVTVGQRRGVGKPALEGERLQRDPEAVGTSGIDIELCRLAGGGDWSGDTPGCPCPHRTDRDECYSEVSRHPVLSNPDEPEPNDGCSQDFTHK